MKRRFFVCTWFFYGFWSTYRNINVDLEWWWSGDTLNWKSHFCCKDDDRYLALIYSSIIGSISTWAYILYHRGDYKVAVLSAVALIW